MLEISNLDFAYPSGEFRLLTVIDESTRECLAIHVARRLASEDVLERLSDLFVRRGVPEHIRSDNGSECTALKVWEWMDSSEGEDVVY